ncbi:MAG TPA: OmpA family protein [Novosphingobium sp.]|nr:OmpA family protein [Novosphingobium sp.]
MLRDSASVAIGAVLTALAFPAAVAAQDAPSNDLMQLSTASLRDEIGQRYDAALARSQDAGVMSADSNVYMWASQAKAQCGIALGFLKSGTKDPVSVGKCADAALRMQGFAAAQPPPQMPAQSGDCSQALAGIVFFDWDSAIPPDSGMQTVDSVVNSMTSCGWSGLTVIGHTDRSGSDAYNGALSVRRAQAIASLLQNRGLSPSQLDVSGRGESEPKVPTIDGERNPTNRRVEITVR